ncbi:TetR/AcrR family transcriptional regulator [Kineococcus aurantiacus]
MEAQREQLSAAVWAVLARDGLPGLTLRAVAERAGCTTGLVLHAFADKRTLLRHARELLHRRTGQRADALEDAAEGSGQDPWETLRAVLHAALSLTEDEREEGRVWVGFLAAAVPDPELRAVHVAHHRAFLDRLERLVGRCLPRSSAAGRTQLAVTLAAQVEGLNALAAADPEVYTAGRQRAAVDRLLDGLR